MNMLKRHYFVLLLLALLFASPGLAAFLFYKNPQWLGAAATNKGQLLNPPELIAGIKAKPKWRLILWNGKDCADSCLKQLDKLARIRLALGRRLYEVDQWLILANDAGALPESLTQMLAEHDIHILYLPTETPKNSLLVNGDPQVFIANTSNYLVLAYALHAAPQDIFHDLKQLLSTTEKKSG